jgi:hypothetical protein
LLGQVIDEPKLIKSNRDVLYVEVKVFSQHGIKNPTQLEIGDVRVDGYVNMQICRCNPLDQNGNSFGVFQDK